MKNQSLLSITVFFTAALSFSLLSFQNVETPVRKTNNGKLKAAPASYHYDSVKVTSSYQLDHAVSLIKQAYARVVYPIFQDDKLNNSIKSAVLSPLKVKYEFQNEFAAEHPALSDLDAINNSATQYQELAANFLKQFEVESVKSDLRTYWYADIHVKVLAKKQDYTAIVCEKDYYTGGLHDLYDHIYLNYDNRTQQLITLNSQIKLDKQDQLKNIAERIFRKNEGLTSTQELDGYFFKNEKFNLPANFTITDNGLLFFYDYYEIKPFAAGTTQLLIPYSELMDIASPGSILGDQVNRH